MSTRKLAKLIITSPRDYTTRAVRKLLEAALLALAERLTAGGVALTIESVRDAAGSDGEAGWVSLYDLLEAGHIPEEAASIFRDAIAQARDAGATGPAWLLVERICADYIAGRR